MKKVLTIEYAYLFVLFVSLSLPYRFYCLYLPTVSSFSLVEPVVFLGLVMLYCKIATRGHIRITQFLLTTVLFLPVILSAFSLLWTCQSGYTLNELAVNIEAFLIYFLTLSFGVNLSRKALLNILFIFCLSLLFVSLASYSSLSFLQPQLPGGSVNSWSSVYLFSYNARLSHPFIGLSNNFATILAMVFPFCLYTGKALHSRLWIALSALLLGAIGATLSRGVMLALFSAFSIYFFLRLISSFRIRKSDFVHFAWIIVGTSAICFAAYNFVPQMGARLVDRLDLRGAKVRFIAIEEAINVISKQPILGYGGGIPFAAYSSASLTSIHNTFIQRFFWYGIPLGLLASCALCFLPVIIRKIPCKDKFCLEIRKGFFIAMLCQVFLMLTEASWEGSTLRIIIFALIGLATSICVSTPLLSSKCRTLM